MCYFFFFSSRRRHTRWPRDWSSDVCSSDLDEAQPFLTVTVVDEDDDEFGIDDRHRLVSGDGNGEVREVVQPGAQGRGEDVLELGQRPRRGLFHPADDAAQARTETDGHGQDRESVV